MKKIVSLLAAAGLMMSIATSAIAMDSSLMMRASRRCLRATQQMNQFTEDCQKSTTAGGVLLKHPIKKMMKKTMTTIRKAVTRTGKMVEHLSHRQIDIMETARQQKYMMEHIVKSSSSMMSSSSSAMSSTSSSSSSSSMSSSSSTPSQ